MRLARYSWTVVAGALLSVIGLPTSWALAQSSGGQTPASQTQAPPANTLTSALDSIRNASDPSAAVDAYARGVAAEPESVELRKAFVDRMIDFGMPALAEQQARGLVGRGVKDPHALAVLADASAAQGRLSQAVSDVSTAADLAPNDEFVQRTAGQVLAWYTTVVDPTEVPSDVKDKVQELRNKLNDEAAFKETYSEALAYYQKLKAQGNEQQQEGAAPTTAPSEQEGYPAEAPTEAPSAPSYQVYNYNYQTPSEAYESYVPDGGYSGYYGPTYAAGYPYYPYYQNYAYPYYYGGYGGYWPWAPDYFIGTSFVPFYPYGFYGGGIFGYRHFHHRFHDRDDFVYHRGGFSRFGFDRFGSNHGNRFGFNRFGGHGASGFGFNRFGAVNHGSNRSGAINRVPGITHNQVAGINRASGFNRLGGVNRVGGLNRNGFGFTGTRHGFTGALAGGNRAFTGRSGPSAVRPGIRAPVGVRPSVRGGSFNRSLATGRTPSIRSFGGARGFTGGRSFGGSRGFSGVRSFSGGRSFTGGRSFSGARGFSGGRSFGGARGFGGGHGGGRR